MSIKADRSISTPGVSTRGVALQKEFHGKKLVSITIRSNIASLQAQRRLAQNSTELSKSFERLSSWLRINRASDDPAGLALSSSLNANARVYTQGLRNISDGLSLLSVAEGALRELSSIAQRQGELAEQAANGVYSLSQRRALQTESDALVNEYNRIIASTSFNGLNPLNKSFSTLSIQQGYGTSGTVSFRLGDELDRSVGSGSYAYGQTVSSRPLKTPSLQPITAAF